MKNIISLLLALVISVNYLNAQYVTIPDSNFVNYLAINYPNCMYGNQMDTTCLEIKTEIQINIGLAYGGTYSYGITNMEGIQYFDSLKSLTTNNEPLKSIEKLPKNLISLSLINTKLDSLQVPIYLEYLRVSNDTSISKISTITGNLSKLNIVDFNYSKNLSLIPQLSNNIGSINISYSGIGVNSINWVNKTNLHYVNLNGLGLSSIPAIDLVLDSDSSNALWLNNNPINDWTNLPSNVCTLGIAGCEIDSLNTVPIPNDLKTLWCGGPMLESLKELPDSLQTLWISHLNSYNLDIKGNYKYLMILSSNINFISNISDRLKELYIANSSLNCLSNLPTGIVDLNLNLLNTLNCLPNYIPAMLNNSITMNGNTLPYYQMPFCTNDPVTNPYACDAVKGVEGYVYEDINSNCIYDSIEIGVKNIPMKLYDGSQNLMEVSATASNGRYFLNSDIGNYLIAIDTTNKPYAVNCKLDTSLNIVAPDTFVQNINFGVECKAGYDVGTKSVVTSGFVFPGQEHSLQIKAGDLSNFYGLSCASSVSGSVTVNITGPVQYSGIQTNALVPTVNGLSFTYSIADFGNVNLENDFGLLFTVDTTAQFGDQICVNVITDPVSQDNVTSNNNYTYCYEVVNSYDPNNKLVYPSSVEPGFNDWLTYTINFQNTGSAPAFNIRLEDTLSTMFDLSSFEVIGFSHTNNYNLDGNKLKIYYPNIMLSDSTTDLEGSKGYFQFRIKPLNPMTAGVDMENEAFIYFDYNAPIQTNMATTSCLVLTSNESIDDLDIKAFPNPLNDILYITGTKQDDVLELYTINGQRVPINVINKGEVLSINVSNISKGIYQLMVKSNTNCKTVKLIK